MDLSGLLSTLKTWLTRIYSRLGFGKIEDIESHSAHGLTATVYWFESDSKNLGHCTPFNTILMNKKLLRELSEDVSNYVFLHELGHTQPHFLLRIFFYVLMVPIGLFALVSPFVAIGQTVGTLIRTGSLYPTAINLVAGITVFLIAVIPFAVLSWIDEGYAELFYLNRAGEQEYIRVSEEISETADKSRIRSIFHKLRYLPPRLVIWISKKI